MTNKPFDHVRGIFSDDNQQRAWRIVLAISVVAGLGIMVLFAIGRGDDWKTVLQLGANSLILGGAALLVGGLLGFLFAIPRRDVERSPDSNGSRYSANTNLEQISDWLTKILVGVGLTQLREIGETLTRVANFFAPALAGDAQAQPFALCVIVYFSTTGFMFAYLWSRIYLGHVMDLAEVTHTVQLEVREQANVDAHALSGTEQQLAPQMGAPPVDQKQLREFITKSSASVKVRIFYKASKVRADNWRTDRPLMERTIPIFEALIDGDPEKRFHKNFGQLGFALTEKVHPDSKRGEEMLNEAISIRGPWNEGIGWVWYEFCRAVCRIRQDPNFGENKPATPELRAKIVEDLRVLESSGQHVKSDLIVKWAQLNGFQVSRVDLENADGS
jgi:hypothetical protein